MVPRSGVCMGLPDQCEFGIGDDEMLESAIGDCAHGGRRAGNATLLGNGVEVNVVGENEENGFWGDREERWSREVGGCESGCLGRGRGA